VPLPLTEATRALVQECIDQGMGDGDLTVLLPRLRRAAGLTDAEELAVEHETL
jgi:hypothetical protein